MGRHNAVTRTKYSLETQLASRELIADFSPNPIRLFKNLLVCTDFSPVSNLAVEEAVRLSCEMSAHLTILHIFEYGTAASRWEDPSQPAEKLRSREDEYLSHLLEHVRLKGASADAVLCDGPASEAIIEQINEGHVDLTIVGTHGFSGVERMVFGSTAERVFRKAACPVLTVGPRVGIRHEIDDAAPIIFATDFQTPEVTAVRYASALARLGGVPLHCINVLPLPMESDSEDAIVPQIMMEALHHLLDDDVKNNVKPICAIIYGSEVSHAIVDYAKAKHAKLIVLGIRRKLPITNHLPPQVTYRTIVTAPCPVLTASFDHD